MATADSFPTQRAEFLSIQISMAAVLGLTQAIAALSGLPRGAAMHMADILKSHSMDDLIYILKISVVCNVTQPWVMLSVKASLLLLYLRISPRVLFRRWVKGLLVLFTVDAIVWSAMAVFQCVPVDRAWIWTKPGRCRNRELLYKAQALWSLAENLVVIGLPIPIVYRLQMHWRRRALLLLAFGVGLIPCGAVIARVIPSLPPEDNPLHIALFPPHLSNQGAYLEFSFLLNASLDIFELRARDRNRVDQDLGMLQAVDERLSIWGWETGTGTKFAVVVDMWGKEGRPSTGLGVKGEDVRPNPFYTPDDYTPMAAQSGRGKGGEITSKKLILEVKRIGDTWKPGLEKI
ncbi:MAG: hypothetical protein Q9216_001284 [Gyalolechia sp. 2 TL-2023]